MPAVSFVGLTRPKGISILRADKLLCSNQSYPPSKTVYVSSNLNVPIWGDDPLVVGKGLTEQFISGINLVMSRIAPVISNFISIQSLVDFTGYEI